LTNTTLTAAAAAAAVLLLCDVSAVHTGEIYCVSSQWRCKDMLQCISEELLCNGEMDCYDGSDEIACGTPIVFSVLHFHLYHYLYFMVPSFSIKLIGNIEQRTATVLFKVMRSIQSAFTTSY